MPMGLVLLVEDDEDIREALADVLLRAGYRVAQASDGHDALAMLRTGTEHPRLALVDMMMPVMSGSDLVATLRSELPELPVVMLSAAPPDEMRLEGVAATVQKPVTRDALLAVVTASIAARS